MRRRGRKGELDGVCIIFEQFRKVTRREKLILGVRSLGLRMDCFLHVGCAFMVARNN